MGRHILSILLDTGGDIGTETCELYNVFRSDYPRFGSNIECELYNMQLVFRFPIDGEGMTYGDLTFPDKGCPEPDYGNKSLAYNN